jgi:hypothetical protein
MDLGRLAPASEVTGGHRRTYLTILERACSANFKMVWYVLLRPLIPELDGKYPFQISGLLCQTRKTPTLKLILNHQKSHTCQNNNMFKFRALLGEACLHKKGQQQTCKSARLSMSKSAVPTSQIGTNKWHLSQKKNSSAFEKTWKNIKGGRSKKAPFLSILRQTI